MISGCFSNEGKGDFCPQAVSDVQVAAAFNIDQSRITSVVETMDRFDGFEAFTEALEQLRVDLRRSGRWIASSRVARVLRDPKKLDQVFEHAVNSAAASYVQANADGEFLQWLIEWFSNGGWEVIIEFIKALLAVI